MHEIFSQLRHVKVDDVRHIGNVDAARRDIGRHEHPVTAFGKALERLVSLTLRTVAVNLRRRPARTAEAARNAIGAMLGAHKHEEAALLGTEQVFEQLLLLVGIHFKGAQLNVCSRLEHRADFDPHRVVEVVARYIPDGAFERGGVAQRLADLGQHAGNARNGRPKAHIEHAVHFVEHENLDLVEPYKLALKKVFQPSGSRHDEARSAADRVKLGLLGQAADHDGRRGSIA